MKATIVTVTHKSHNSIPTYVESFLHHHGQSFCDSIEFVFVENSQDQAMEQLLAPLRLAGYTVTLKFMQNRGFGAACNLGAEHAAGAALMFINPDVSFTEPLSDLGQIEGAWGTGCQRDGSGHAFSFDVLPEHKSIAMQFTRGHLRMTPPPPAWASRVFPVGSFFCCDRALFFEVGGFDETFFLYHEEAELARRLHVSAGLPKYFSTLSLVHHQFGSESDRALTSRHEMEGLFTYAAVTGCRSVLRKRLILLLLMSPVRAQARERLMEFLQRLRAS